MDVTEFITTLFGESEGFLFIATKDDEGRLNNQQHFKYPENIKQVAKYVSLREDIDVYFSPMLYSVPRRRSSAVSRTPIVYCDTDMFDVDKFLLPPTINVQTSTDPVKHHSYWVLDKDTYKPDDVSDVARAIALYHASKENGKQTGTDPSGWDLTQLLRLPYGVNTKHTPPQPVTIATVTGEIYSLAQLAETYDPANLPHRPMAADTEVPTDLPDNADVIRRFDHRMMALYTKEPIGEWSSVLYLFCSEMFRAGFTAEEVFVAAMHAASNKYARDKRPVEDLWRNDVLKAQADPANKPLSKSDMLASDPPVRLPKDAGIAADIEVQLLREHEREMLSHTFVDRYSEWAQSKTDAPAPYHVAGALTAMSCVLGEWGIALPKYGPLKLGLFFVVMGETTDTRKTTARNQMKRLIRMTQIGDYDYVLTSDTTPETLLDALAERPHQSSLYDRDEFQSLIDDVKHKAYMRGFFETMNELYDGTAHGRMRKDKRTEDTPVNFVQYAMGIRSQIQDNLEVSDFKSGYLPRNIFVRGEAPPRTKENSYLQQGNPLAHSADAVFNGLIRELVNARNFWAAKVGDRAAPLPIMFEDDAWDRWNEFAWDLRKFVDTRSRAELLIPSVQRLGQNVLKVATLFAMIDNRETGTMQDVLNAIYYGAQWVEDLIIMAEGVSESELQREIDKVEEFIRTNGGSVRYTALLKWSVAEGIKGRELVDYLEYLTEAEIVKVVEAQGVKAVELAYLSN